MKELLLVNLENVADDEANTFKVREAARGVIFDPDQNVAMLYSTVNKYYKLPGGGIEEGEKPLVALKRECREEIGCNVEVGAEIGMIIEYRKKHSLRQVSYCYLAHINGKKGTPELTEDEIEEGFKTVWMSLDEAIKVTSTAGDPTVYEAPYMTMRDHAFLIAAKNFKHG